MCILGPNSKAVQALPKDQHHGTKDTEKPLLEAKPKPCTGHEELVFRDCKQPRLTIAGHSLKFGSSINSPTIPVCVQFWQGFFSL